MLVIVMGMLRGKLEESHEKLSSSNDDLLASHTRLKLALEAITTKVTSCEPHVVTSTICTQNAILPCASPSNSSTHIIAKSCDELLVGEHARKNKKILAQHQDHMRGERQRIIPFNELAEFVGEERLASHASIPAIRRI